MVAIIHKRSWRDFDWILAFLAIAIVLFGTIQIRNAQPTETYWVKQLIGLSIGLVAMLAIAFSIWQVLSTFIFNPFLIPPPLEVIRTAIPMIMSGEIFADVAISMTRVLVGFVSGSLAGVVLGVLLGRIRILHDLLDPIMELLRYLSPTAMIPIAVIWFGIGEMSKYFLIFWGTFFIVLVNTTAGVWRAPIARQRGGISPT